MLCFCSVFFVLYPMLPVSLHCSFFIAPSVFSKVYVNISQLVTHILNEKHKQYRYIVGKYIMMSLYSFRNCWWVFLASFTVSANTFYFYRKVQNHCHILTKRAEGSVVLIVFKGYPPSRPTERGSQPGWGPMAHEFKQVESCFLNHNSSIHFCCTDSSLLMTHRGGLSLSIIIWGPKILLAALPLSHVC